MRRQWIGILAAVGLLAAASACDRPAGDSTGPAGLVAPRAAVAPTGGFLTASGYTLLTGPAATSNTFKSAVIGRIVTLGPAGGKISVGGNQLTVPQGAVSEPVRFTFIMADQPYLAAQLSAVRVRDGAAVTQFPVALTLKLSYASSPTPVPNPAKLKVFYVANGEVLATQPTTVDIKGQSLSCSVKHFSEYSPGLDP